MCWMDCFIPSLPSAIAPSTRMPDSLTTQSGWKSSSFSRGRICSSSSSLNTLANTSRAAAEHLPDDGSEAGTCKQKGAGASYRRDRCRVYFINNINVSGGLRSLWCWTHAGSSLKWCRRRPARRPLRRRPRCRRPRAAGRPFGSDGSVAWCLARCLGWPRPPQCPPGAKWTHKLKNKPRVTTGSRNWWGIKHIYKVTKTS